MDMAVSCGSVPKKILAYELFYYDQSRPGYGHLERPMRQSCECVGFILANLARDTAAT